MRAERSLEAFEEARSQPAASRDTGAAVFHLLGLARPPSGTHLERNVPPRNVFPY